MTATKRAPRPGEGRPTKFTEQLADQICEELALGYSMRTVCKKETMPSMATVFSWLRTKPEFLEQYEKAKQESTDAMAEDILDIADDSSGDTVEVEGEDGEIKYVANKEYVQRSRLRVDTRKWLMSKMKPKKYGEKMDLTSGDKPLNGNMIVIQDFSNGTSKTDSE